MKINNKNRSKIRLLIPIGVTLLALQGCGPYKAHPGDSNYDPYAVQDPVEGANRASFWLFEIIDNLFLKPAATAWTGFAPEPVQKGVRNFLTNLKTPVVLVNQVLQGKISAAGETIARFGANTLGGIGGLVDVASHQGIPKHEEDFGQTLGVWGLKEGPYLFFPFLGPSSVRDATGRIVDFFFDPLNIYAAVNRREHITYIRVAATAIDERGQLLKVGKEIEERTKDLYATVRDVWWQRQVHKLYDGNPPDVITEADEDLFD